MTYFLKLLLLISFVSLGLCEQQEDNIQFATLRGWIPKIRRTFRTLGPMRQVNGNGLQLSSPSLSRFARSEYSTQFPPLATPSLPYMGNYQLPYYPPITNSYRRYRNNLPPSLSSSDAVSVDEVDERNEQEPSTEQIGRLRFLGWLFGRPSYSRYPDYSMLEQAAGVPYGSRLPSYGYNRPYSHDVVVEDCVELLDPLSGHIVEECHEVPAYH